MIRIPDPTLRNALVTPLLLARIPIMVLGRILVLLGDALERIGGAIPAWTDDRRIGR